MSGPASRGDRLLLRMDEARHRIPFWWWLTYDALVLLVIVAGNLRGFALALGLSILAVAVVIDTVEFLVKRPAARRRIAAASNRSDSE